MSIQDVIRAWKDADYRDSLSDAERALLPAHPGGLVELSDAEMGNAAAGALTWSLCTVCIWQCATRPELDGQ